MQKREAVKLMLQTLEDMYRDTGTALMYSTPYELLIAVVLSAQCTDERVNKITRQLFQVADTPEKIINLGRERLEELIKGCGLYHNKAVNILAASSMLLEKYNGVIPATMEELLMLPGVGRKTANVLLSQLYDIPAIAVDTHVFRVANRLGIARGETPQKVEEGLKKAIPRNKWSHAHHWLIWHGRKICKARKPSCNECRLSNICPSAIQ